MKQCHVLDEIYHLYNLLIDMTKSYPNSLLQE